MLQVTLPEMQKGPWRVEKMKVDRIQLYKFNRTPPMGITITRLALNGKTIMSDTPAEQADHEEALSRATGSCLINGLGLGMLLKNVLLKTDVTDVTVVELDQDVIDLISPHYPDPRVKYVCSDAAKYKPPKGKQYGMVWHDIWPDMCSNNLPMMVKLMNKYKNRARWQGCWAEGICRAAAVEESILMGALRQRLLGR